MGDVAMDVDAQPTLKRKGRGFQHDGGREQELKKEGFDSVDEEGSGSAQRSVEGWIIIVTGVHEEATEEDIMERFNEYGHVKGMHLNLDRRTGFVKGYALVEYDTYKEAKTAIDGENGKDFLGHAIHCDFAFSRGPVGGARVQQNGGGRRGGRR
ncbi:RNA-binding domain-containing protein [Gonapodya prolifera JEL478]|uniref:RNA-binding protein 8A n=1 Tax=Gonapodya prolifera (strain JEL478) TaxID=1344416 RepID=A0A138ZZQ7_GONPJ|nr:RNA-binding domain-containing protein [Gonapodya prolifera JEL478]|eukprot:KXS09996.1 RNA-binding domain-containing protein [Gonapodya prolifera JEL478]